MSRLYNSLPSLPTYPNALNPFAGAGGPPLQTAQQVGNAYGTNYNNALSFSNAQLQGIEQGYGQLLSSQQDAQGALGRGYVDLANQTQNYLNPMDAAGQELRAGYAGIVGRPGGGQTRGYREGQTLESLPGTGYAGLSQSVQNLLAGSNQSNLNDIDQQYGSAQGRTLSRLIGTGLGNSTVLSAASLGVDQSRARERTASQNQFSQLQASYLDRLGQAGLLAQERGLNAGVQQTNQTAGLRASYGNAIGQAGLNFGERSYLQNSQLGQNQLNFQNSVQAQYPDAGMYNALIQQQGAALQAQQDRAQSQRLNEQLLQQGRQATPQIGGGTSLGTGTPLPGPQGYYGSTPTFPPGPGSAGLQYAPDGTRLQAQAPAYNQYGLGGYGGAALGGIGAASAGGFGNPGNIGAASAGAIGAGVGSYLDGLGQGGAGGGGYDLANEDLPYGGMAPPIAYGPAGGGNSNYFGPQQMPLGLAPVADSYLPAEDWSSGFFGW